MKWAVFSVYEIKRKLMYYPSYSIIAICKLIIVCSQTCNRAFYRSFFLFFFPTPSFLFHPCLCLRTVIFCIWKRPCNGSAQIVNVHFCWKPHVGHYFNILGFQYSFKTTVKIGQYVSVILFLIYILPNKMNTSSEILEAFLGGKRGLHFSL